MSADVTQVGVLSFGSNGGLKDAEGITVVSVLSRHGADVVRRLLVQSSDSGESVN